MAFPSKLYPTHAIIWWGPTSGPTLVKRSQDVRYFPRFCRGENRKIAARRWVGWQVSYLD